MSTTTKKPAKTSAPRAKASPKAVPPQAGTTPETATTLPPTGVATRTVLMSACRRASSIIGSEAVTEILKRVGGHKTIGRVPAAKLPEVYDALNKAIDEAQTAESTKPAPEVTVHATNPAPTIKALREAANALESGRWIQKSGGIKCVSYNQERNFEAEITSDLVLVPIPNNKATPTTPTHRPVPEQSAQPKLSTTFSDITETLTHEAEHRRLMFQTEAAINLGIGLVLNSLGQKEIKIYPAALQEFSRDHRVVPTLNPDGSYTLTIVER